MLMGLKLPIRYLKGIGPVRAKTLLHLGVKTVGDLLGYYPRSYQDRSSIVPVHRLVVDAHQTFYAKVVGHSEGYFRRRGMMVNRVILSDGVGFVTLLFFNQPNILRYLQVGKELIVSGRVRRFRNELQLTNFDYEILTKEEPLHSGRLVPLYPLKEGLPPGTQRLIRRAVRAAIDGYLSKIRDPVPYRIISRYRLPSLRDALRSIHFPANPRELESARRRIIFDEFLILQLALGLLKNRRRREKGIAFITKGELVKRFIRSLPFSLTSSQIRVIQEIRGDMESASPMNRLLHGEVGSGKTLVAIASALIAIEAGWQVAIMVPTEILAEQHYLNLKRLLSPLEVRVSLLTSGIVGKEREGILSDISCQRLDIVVGTHALIQEGVEFARLGLCIIDEQHRFGVIQRSTLLRKATKMKTPPDLLIMTATPIPRTLALTIYGDLEVSFLDEVPPGRGRVRTFCRSEKELGRIYDFIKKEVSEGHQAYIIYPIIEASEDLDLKAAKDMVEVLKNGVFNDLRVGLLHGRMKTTEKEETMRAFRDKEIDVLVCTTVVEVGIDIPDATVMLITHAERLGLAQLHQLRGRIGRGGERSFCILLTTPEISELINQGIDEEILEDEVSKAAKRINTMVKTSDGFKIAEMDLELRGPGEFFGTRQHGMPALRMANLIRDRKWLDLAHKEARVLLEEDHSLREYPLLRELLGEYLKEHSRFTMTG